MDELAQQDHSYKLTYEEYKRYKNNWYLTLNNTGRSSEPMKLRPDYRAAVVKKNALHRQSGEVVPTFIHPGHQRRRRPGQDSFSQEAESGARVDERTGWKYWPSSSSWWTASEWDWSSAQ